MQSPEPCLIASRSPRYQGHMCCDVSMPAVLGYFMTMLYNPNNVAFEASPITTVVELEVGQQLSKLFGYNIDAENRELPEAWGHITCDGTVANLEGLWVARNLKFYPLSIRSAMKEGGPLAFIAKDFVVETCSGPEKLFHDLSVWELLNLKPTTILDIPERLYSQYYISSQFLNDVMKKYGIQSTGKQTLQEEFNVPTPHAFVAYTKHYSWPKSAGKHTVIIVNSPMFINKIQPSRALARIMLSASKLITQPASILTTFKRNYKNLLTRKGQCTP